jgi:hypothetical protein
MACEQPFHIGSAEFLQAPGIGYDMISLSRFRDTGRLRAGVTLDIDDAHAADGVRGQAGVAAERGNMHASPLGSVEQSRAIIYLDRPAIDRKLDHKCNNPRRRSDSTPGG